eukprot:9649446-Lingulodinium_polyedra.AAC.1
MMMLSCAIIRSMIHCTKGYMVGPRQPLPEPRVDQSGQLTPATCTRSPALWSAGRPEDGQRARWAKQKAPDITSSFSFSGSDDLIESNMSRTA